MQTLVDRGCGLDVHQATVVACLLIVLKNGQVQKQVRTFGTTTRELMGLREWLLSGGCTHVAMESTGVYWKPIYAILEGALEIVVANAQHIKKVPGRKTDVKDAEWIADLLCHGLLRSSFVPPKPIRELRDLMRYRRKRVEGQAAERNRLLKVLETANIKLANVATDVFGMSGRLMLRALIAGKAAPQEMVRTGQRASTQEDSRTGAGSGRQVRTTPSFPVGASAATTRSGGKRPSGSRTTHPADARTLCGASLPNACARGLHFFAASRLASASNHMLLVTEATLPFSSLARP